jgi:hypothetical protein
VSDRRNPELELTRPDEAGLGSTAETLDIFAGAD